MIIVQTMLPTYGLDAELTTASPKIMISNVPNPEEPHYLEIELRETAGSSMESVVREVFYVRLDDLSSAIGLLMDSPELSHSSLNIMIAGKEYKIPIIKIPSYRMRSIARDYDGAEDDIVLMKNWGEITIAVVRTSEHHLIIGTQSGDAGRRAALLKIFISNEEGTIKSDITLDVNELRETIRLMERAFASGQQTGK